MCFLKFLSEKSLLTERTLSNSIKRLVDKLLCSSDSDDRLIQPTTLPETLEYEMKQMTMLETPPPGTVATQRKSDSESDIINNQNSFAILDSLEEAGSSDTGLNHKLQSPIGRPSDKIAKTISRNLFGTQRKKSTSELLSVCHSFS